MVWKYSFCMNRLCHKVSGTPCSSWVGNLIRMVLTKKGKKGVLFKCWVGCVRILDEGFYILFNFKTMYSTLSPNPAQVKLESGVLKRTEKKLQGPDRCALSSYCYIGSCVCDWGTAIAAVFAYADTINPIMNSVCKILWRHYIQISLFFANFKFLNSQI